MSHHDHDNDEFASVLRSAVDSAEFDYEALMAGTQQRVGRLRRRRALVTGVAVAVLGPALVGGAALVLPEVLPDHAPGMVAPASSGEDAGRTSGPVVDDAATTSGPTAPHVPWQDSVPPLPEGGPEPENPDFPNAWAIPDARPTGVAELDALGAPQLFMDYPRVAPVMGLMTCDPGRAGGVEPVAAQHASFFADETGEEQSDLLIEITITGWQDSSVARDGLINDTTTLCTWDSQVGPAQPWPGHEGDADYRLFATDTQGDAAAVVRQGDYLIAITVQPASAAEPTTSAGSREAADIAAEIASKTADNLAVLDPAHGRD